MVDTRNTPSDDQPDDAALVSTRNSLMRDLNLSSSTEVVEAFAGMMPGHAGQMHTVLDLSDDELIRLREVAQDLSATANLNVKDTATTTGIDTAKIERIRNLARELLTDPEIYSVELDRANFTEVLHEITAPTDLVENMAKAGIISFSPVRHIGVDALTQIPGITPEFAALLTAHAQLTTISSDIPLNRSLIEAGITRVSKIAQLRECQFRVVKPIKGRRKRSKKPKNGAEEMTDRKAYPSDLTDAEWEILEPLIPAISEEAVHIKYTRREIVNGILYVLRSGCPWRLMPHDLPAWGTVYDYFRQWQKQGVWDQVLEALRRQKRKKQGRDEEPSAAVIDSQSIKTSAVRGPEKGFDMGKRIWGRKRNLLVDTQGDLMEVKVTAASASDVSAGKKLLSLLRGRFPRLSLIWGDSHYGGQFLEWVKEQFGWNVQPVQHLGTPHDTNVMEPKPKTKTSKRGFVLEPRRWVVERSIAWITRWRRLCRDHEGLPQTSETFIKLSASRRMLSHLAPAFPAAVLG